MLTAVIARSCLCFPPHVYFIWILLYLLIKLLLLLCEDAGDLLGELNKVAQLCQLLTDPAYTGRKSAAAGHAAGQLTLCVHR